MKTFWKNSEKSGKWINLRKMKLSYHILLVHQTFYNEIWLKLRRSENLKKNPKNPEDRQKTDKFPENKVIISYLKSKPPILLRNTSKIAEI